MNEPAVLAIIFFTFLLGGIVKGAVGLGMATVTLAILAVAIDLPSAMALLLIPTLVTNIWQALTGGSFKELLNRLWPFLLVAMGFVWLGGKALVSFNIIYLSALLGVILVFYAIISLGGFRINLNADQEKTAGLIIGSINGILTGMTGSLVVPGVMYLQALELSKDKLVQAMGMLFTVSTVGLAVILGRNNLLTTELGFISLVGLVPAIIGMFIGQAVRGVLTEQQFRRVLFIALLLLGAYIIFGAIRELT
ncbi:MAG: sulfite exporter TauE/SafE family protein [Rhizobiaceae bacterium]